MLTLTTLRELLFDPSAVLFGVRMPHGRRTTGGKRQRPMAVPSLVQVLEDRTLLTGYVVDTLVDQTYGGGDFATETTGPDAGLSLREAIGLANANGFPGDPMGGELDGDTITFAPGLTGTIMIDGNGQLEILDDVVIDGTGADITVNGGHAVRLFSINASGIGTADLVEIANLTLDSGYTGGSAGDDGGAIFIADAHEVVLLDTVNVTNNVAFDDGGGIFNNGGTLTITNSLIDNNDDDGSADATGGGIASTAGTVTITDTTISRNNTSQAGGGIEVIDGTLELNNVVLDSNWADAFYGGPGNGGGVHVSGTASVTIVGGSIINNKARSEGGGLWNQADATMTVENGTLIEGNIASGTGADNGGGGIFNNGGTLFINGTTSAVTINGNSAGPLHINQTPLASGGGIFSAGGMVTIDSAVITNNDAQRAGGGIEIIDGTLEIVNTEIAFNSALGNAEPMAPGNGGGIHVSGTMGTLVNISGGSITNNFAASEGGGLWNQFGSVMNVESKAGAVLIDGNTAGGDAADNGGGGIFNNGGMMTISGTNNGVTISNNVADGTSGSGGGIFSTGGGVTVFDTSISGNMANRAGGGIEVVGGLVRLSRMTLGGATPAEGNVAGPMGSANPGNGGGLHISAAATVYVDSSLVQNNVAAEEGGGLWNSSTGILNVRAGSQVLDNRASGAAIDQGGGGIFNNGGFLGVYDATISGNAADGALGNGGGIFVGPGGRVRLRDSTISDNEASRAGGGIEDRSGTVGQFDLSNVHLDANSAGINGGGLHITGSGGVVIDAGTVSGNTAGEEGGGLWNSATGTMTIDGTSINSNTAGGTDAEQGGGGVFNDGGTVTISNALIDSNVAMGDDAGEGGGGIFNDGTMDLVNTVVSNNTATNGLGNGGGILNSADGVLSADGGRIPGNAAARAGGGIENNGGIVTLHQVYVDANTAGINGGGVHASGAAKTYADATAVFNNEAGEEGGGLWNSAGGLLIVRNDSIVSDNVAHGVADDQGGGGIFNDGGRLAIQTSDVESNIADGAAGSGGGIFSVNGVVTVDDSWITNNTAVRAGGGIEVVTGTVELHNSHLNGNSALGGGMGAPGNGGGLHVTGVMGTLGYVRIFGGTVNGNTAAREGGGLWNQEGNVMVVRQGAIVDGNTASGDAADDGGGGLFNNNGRLAIGEGAQITNNLANGLLGSGGGVFSLGGVFSTETGTVISGNTAVRAGGGIEVVDGSNTLIDSTIDDNHALGGGMGAPGNGGGIHVTGNMLTRLDLLNTVVSNNTAATDGGGIWHQINSTLLVRAGSQVIGNTASGDVSGQGGGGIFNNGGRVVIDTAVIDGNAADGITGSGGGLLTRNGVVTVANSDVTSNTAVRAGGGIEIVDGLLETRNMNLSGNAALGGGPGAPGNGGGLHVTGNMLTRVTIFGGTVSGNTAANEGGGLWNQVGSIMVVRDGATIDGNTASGDPADAGGGGIFNKGGRLAITQTTISNNVADGVEGSGGGVFSLGGGVTIDNSTVSGNWTNGNGGGVASNGDMINANSTFANNRADADEVGGGTGGGIFNGGTATLNNSIVADNLVGFDLGPVTEGPAGLDPQAVGGPGVMRNDVGGNPLRGNSGFNLISDAASSGGLMDGVNGNIVGDHGAGFLPLASILDPLADNGGATLTHALTAGSLAIDAGSNMLAKDINNVPFTTDQRGAGFPRINNDVVDMGAVEV